jgi:hypothetical protein
VWRERKGERERERKRQRERERLKLLLKECSLGWLISSVAFEILRFTVL